jgi:hypothetical protein
VSDLKIRDGGLLSVDPGCSASSKNAECHVGINWNNVDQNQNPFDAGARPKRLNSQDNLTIYMGAFVQGEISYSVNLKLFGSSSIDLNMHIGALGQIGFEAASVYKSRVNVFDYCYGIPELSLEGYILWEKFEFGLFLCGELGISHLNITSGYSLKYIRNFTADYRKHISFSTKGIKNDPSEVTYGTALDTSVHPDSTKEVSRYDSLEFTPDISIYPRLVAKFGSVTFLDIKTGVRLGKKFTFKVDTAKCLAPFLYGKIAFTIKMFASLDFMKFYGFSFFPNFYIDKTILEIDEGISKCLFSPSGDSRDGLYTSGNTADLLIIRPQQIYWHNEGNHNQKWTGTFGLKLNVYVGPKEKSQCKFRENYEFGNFTVAVENDNSNPLKFDRIVAIKEPDRLFKYVFRVDDPSLIMSVPDQSHGRPWEESSSFKNEVLDQQQTDIQPDDNHILRLTYNVYPVNETKFGLETRPLNITLSNYGIPLKESFGSFTIPEKAENGDQFAVIQHNDSTPYVSSPYVFYVDSVARSDLDFQKRSYKYNGQNITMKKKKFNLINLSEIIPDQIKFHYINQGEFNFPNVKLHLEVVDKYTSSNVISRSTVQYSLRKETSKTSRWIFWPFTKEDTYYITLTPNQFPEIYNFPIFFDPEEFDLQYYYELDISNKGTYCLGQGRFSIPNLDKGNLDVHWQANSNSFPFSVSGEYGSHLYNFEVSPIQTDNEVAFIGVENLPNAQRIIAQVYEINYTETNSPSIAVVSFLTGAVYSVLMLNVKEKLNGQNHLIIEFDRKEFIPLVEHSWINEYAAVITLQENITRFSDLNVIHIPLRLTGPTLMQTEITHLDITFKIHRLFYGAGNSLCSSRAIITAESNSFISTDFGCIEHPRTNAVYVAEAMNISLTPSYVQPTLDLSWRINCWRHSFIGSTKVFIHQTYYEFPNESAYLVLQNIGSSPITVSCPRCSNLELNNMTFLKLLSNTVTFQFPGTVYLRAFCDSIESPNCFSTLHLNKDQTYVFSYQEEGIIDDINFKGVGSLLESHTQLQIINGRENVTFTKNWTGSVSVVALEKKSLAIAIKVEIKNGYVELSPFACDIPIPFSHSKFLDFLELYDNHQAINVVENETLGENETLIEVLTNDPCYNTNGCLIESEDNYTAYSRFLEKLSFLPFFKKSDNITFTTNGTIRGPSNFFTGQSHTILLADDLFDLPNEYYIDCIFFDIFGEEKLCNNSCWDMIEIEGSSNISIEESSIILIEESSIGNESILITIILISIASGICLIAVIIGVVFLILKKKRNLINTSFEV